MRSASAGADDAVRLTAAGCPMGGKDKNTYRVRHAALPGVREDIKKAFLFLNLNFPSLFVSLLLFLFFLSFSFI